MTATIAYVLLGFAALNAWVCWMNVKKASELDAQEHSLGLRLRLLEKRRRLVDERRLRCLAFEQLLEIRATRLGVDSDCGVRRARA